MTRCILALDQGTTSSRAIVYDAAGQILGRAQQEFRQILPAPGHVEHDAEEIWTTQLNVAREALAAACVTAADVAAIGVTNQRETTVLWERATGKPVANAIVWQSRISAKICERLKNEGHSDLFARKTGLVIDAYFSGTKIKHLLDTVDGLRRRAEAGEICFGTIDSWLLWRLSGGKLHITDASNASRTLLFNIHTLEWDDELLDVLNIPRAMLPRVVPSSEVYGETFPELFGGAIPLAGIAGDQQAATFGQGCFSPGMAKNTYGTGCFLLMNTGEQPIQSSNQMLTTVGWLIDGRVTYCLEGAIFIAGAAVQWLRDGLGLVRKAADIEALAARVADTGGTYLVPAFVGLGAPYWDPYARGAILGITRGTTAAHLARAALESMAYQTRDVVEAMERDAGMEISELRADGGASVNDQLMQFQADILDSVVRRARSAETTSFGAASLAGLAVGFWNSPGAIARDEAFDRFTPSMQPERRDALYRGWRKAVSRALAWEDAESAATGE